MSGDNTIGPTRSLSNADIDTQIERSKHPDAPLLPPPDLARLLMGGDLGAQVAALVLMTERDHKKSARSERDAAYAEADRAQRTEIDHMASAANTRLVTGLLSGGAEITAGGFTCRGAVSELHGATAQAHNWEGWAKGAQGTGKMTDALGNFFASAQDQTAKSEANAAERAKKTAEDHHDDMRDADESIKKSIEFLKQWNQTRDATMMAAIHRA